MNVNLLPYQRQFLQSTARFTWLKAGLGSGKTYALAWYVVLRMLKNPETLGLIAANTYVQLTGSILNEVFNVMDRLGLSYHYNPLYKTLQLHTNGAVALVLSLEKYEQLRGIELGWAAIDELAFARKEAYDIVIGRLRCKKSHALQLRAASTPNGFNFLYDKFAKGVYISRTTTPVCHSTRYHEMISASAYDNIYLPQDYLNSLASQYDPLFFQQEVYGEFVNTSEGLVFHAFNRERNLQPTVQISSDVRAGCDFNVNPLTAVIGDVSGTQRVHIHKEIWLKHSNTFELAETLASVQPGMIVVPDATGSARKTSAAQTDHQILRDAGLDVRTKLKNPAVKDRQNNTNRWLANGWLTIDPKCTNLIQDLDKLTHDNDDDMLGHISDGLGYLLWNINPLKRSVPTPQVRPR